MAEYIERGEIQAAMKFVTDDITCPLHIAAEIDQVLALAPAADVRPERHGRWSEDMVAVKETAPGFHSDDVRFGFQCSECGEISNYKTPYCGYCTAKMDLGNRNPIGSNARIVNTGTLEKPYYQIEYQDNNDGTPHLGYGSTNFDIVIYWLSRYFDSGAKMKAPDAETENGGAQ